MLSYFFIKQRWLNYVKNSFYLDYGLKFILKSTVYTFLIHTAYFFAEKYIIEYSTRYVFNYFSYRFYTLAFRLTHAKLAVFTVLAAANMLVVLL